MDVAGDNAHLGQTGRGNSRAVGAHEAHGPSLKKAHHAQHVPHGDALGDADNERNARVGGLQDSLRRVGRRDIDDRGVGARLLSGGGEVVVHGHARLLLTSLARRDTSDDRGAILQHLPGMERALAAGDALHDDAGGTIHENAQRSASKEKHQSTRIQVPYG